MLGGGGGGGVWGGEEGRHLRNIQKIRHFCLISVFTITESFAKINVPGADGPCCEFNQKQMRS